MLVDGAIGLGPQAHRLRPRPLGDRQQADVVQVPGDAQFPAGRLVQPELPIAYAPFFLTYLPARLLSPGYNFF